MTGTVEAARAKLAVVETLTEDARAKLQLALRMRAEVLTELPAGTTLTWDAGGPDADELRYQVTLKDDGTWTAHSDDPQGPHPETLPVPAEWIAEQWSRGNLHLPAAPASPAPGSCPLTHP